MLTITIMKDMKEVGKNQELIFSDLQPTLQKNTVQSKLPIMLKEHKWSSLHLMLIELTQSFSFPKLMDM